jgi:hypothetical protein
MICEFCGKIFKRKYTLKRHQTITVCRKFIDFIETQNSLNEQITTLQQQNLKLTDKIEQLKDENNELKLTSCIYEERLNAYEEKYNAIKEDYTELKLSCNKSHDNLVEQANKTHETLLERATTKTNNTKIQTIINSLSPLDMDDQDKLLEILRNKFDESTLRLGVVGATRILCEEVLVDDDGRKKYIILDNNRLHGGFITPDKKLVRDPNMKQLIEYACDPFAEVAELTLEERHKNLIAGDFTPEYQGYLGMTHLKKNNKNRKKFRETVSKHM